MNFRPADFLKRPLVLAAAVFLAVFSAPMRYAPLQAGQPIWFSSPQSDAISSNVPTLSSKPLVAPDFSKSSDVPLPFDFNEPPVATPPLSVPLTISPAEQEQLQDWSDRRKNWLLLTPAEILGVTTPEKILGIHEYDAFGQQKHLTAMERYTERQKLASSASSNALQNGDSSSAWNLSRNRPDPSDVFHPLNGGPEDSASTAYSTLNSGLDNRTSARRGQNDNRSKNFDSPTPLPAPNAAQQMNLERFRQLLGSSPATVPAASPSSNDKLFSLLGISSDVKPGQPSLNPIGTSFSLPNNSVGKPADMPTLPSTLGLSYTSSRPAAAWAPQSPPWTSPDAQTFAVPQRKF